MKSGKFNRVHANGLYVSQIKVGKLIPYPYGRGLSFFYSDTLAIPEPHRMDNKSKSTLFCYGMNEHIKYDDHRLVAGLLSNDAEIIRYVFYARCNKLFQFIINSIFDGRVSQDELISELFLYLANNDWTKVRKFDFRSSFYTWLSVVAVRFFQKKRDSLLEIALPETLISYMREEKEGLTKDYDSFELKSAIKNISNPRYRDVITQLDLEDKEQKNVAESLGITVANLYNLHRRALISLRNIYI